MNVGVLEAKNRLSELIEAARRGEEVLITKRGEPAARLVAVESKSERHVRSLAALAEMKRIGEEIVARNGGRRPTWDEIKQDRDEGRR